MIDVNSIAWHESEECPTVMQGTKVQISPQLIAVDDNVRIDLNCHSLLEMLGHDCIEKIITKIIDKNVYAHICYVHMHQLTEELQANPHGRSRFFNVISFTKEII